MPASTTQFEFGPIGNRVIAFSGFALAGAMLALSMWSVWLVFSMVHDVWRARNWPVAQASVLHVSMTTTREPRRLGYFNVRTRYRHAHGDGSYESGRLVFTGQSGETADVWDGKWLAGVVGFLEDSRLSGRPVPVFVNPADPADAVVFRDMVWGNYIMRCLLMILLGLGPLGVAAVYLPRWQSPRAARTTKIVIALLFPAIALAGALVAASA